MKSRIDKFVAELRSRSVGRAIVAYAVASWMLLQVADVTFDRLPLPDNAMTILIVLVIVGFPVTAIIAWGYEFTLQGVVRHESTDGGAPRMAFTSYIVLVVAVSVASASLFYFVAEHYWEPDPRSIAVLPFENLTTGEDNEYFADGLTDEIQNLIVRINEFRVVALSTSHQFKDTVSDVITIANKLNADVVLQGSVRRNRDSVSVSARLIDGTNGLAIWSQTFEEQLADAPSIQDQIARQVARALHVVLPVSADRRLERMGTSNIDAYDSYLRGLDYLRQPLDQVVLGLAETNLKQALALDPEFGSALAATCFLKIARYRKTSDASLFDEAEDACESALEKDDDSAALYSALGNLYFESGEYERSLEFFDEALGSNSNYTDAYIGTGQSLAALGRLVEAEENFRQAIDKDVSYWAGFNAMGNFLFERGRFLEAAEFYKLYIGRANDDSQAFNNLGAAYYMAGMFRDAAEAWDSSLAIKPTRSAYSNTGSMYYYVGQFEKAADRFAQAVNLSPNDYVMWGNLADAYFQIDSMKSAATTAYQRAIELAESTLRVNERDVDAMSSLAYYYSRIGYDERARSLNAEAVGSGAESFYVHYNSALIHAHYGELEEALGAVETALQLDFQPEMLGADPGLRALHDKEEFKRMLEQAGG